MVEIDKNGIVKGNILEKNEYIQLNPGCYITTDVNILATNIDVKIITICRWKEGESGRDLMGYSSRGGGYWGVRDNTWDSTSRISGMSNNIYEKNTVTYQYDNIAGDGMGEYGTYKIGSLNNDYSVRTKYIYYVEIWVDGVLRGKFIPEKGGMRNIVTNTFCPTSNDNWELSTDYVVMFLVDDKVECNEIKEI